jgi:hypothetical protein
MNTLLTSKHLVKKYMKLYIMSATKKEDGMFLNETKMLVRNDKIPKKNKNLEKIESNYTPEDDKITTAKKIENSLWLLNDRIGQRAEHPEGDFIPKSNFNPEQEELLKEYNDQYPDSFESTDEHGNKVVRPFLLPEVDLDINLDYSSFDNRIQELQQHKEDLLINRGLLAKQISLHEKQLAKVIQIYTTKKNELYYYFKANVSKQNYNAKEGEAFQRLEKLIDDNKEKIQKEKFMFDGINRQIDLTDEEIKQIIQRKGETKNNNQSKLREYTDVFNSLNRGRFSTRQEPNETDEDYLERLKRNAEIEQPKQKLEDIVFMVSKKFKELLKELGIRNNSTIESVSNSLSDLTKSDILKKRGVFKNKFIKLFGENNKDIKPIDILNFINELKEIYHPDESVPDLFTPANEPDEFYHKFRPPTEIFPESFDLFELPESEEYADRYNEPQLLNEEDLKGLSALSAKMNNPKPGTPYLYRTNQNTPEEMAYADRYTPKEMKLKEKYFELLKKNKKKKNN